MISDNDVTLYIMAILYSRLRQLGDVLGELADGGLDIINTSIIAS